MAIAVFLESSAALELVVTVKPAAFHFLMVMDSAAKLVSLMPVAFAAEATLAQTYLESVVR